ncbi:MAG: NUDIX domain-containing protein [Sneathiella sp.]
MPHSPRVGCGALIRNAQNQILLVKRLREPEAGHWGFPGGKVDFGETTEDATCREVTEELGITITLGPLAHLVNYIDIPKGEHWLAPVYTAVISNGEPEIQEPDALSEWGWFDEDALPEKLTEATCQTVSAKR